MAWWYTILLVLTAAAGASVLTWLLTRGRGSADVGRLVAAERERASTVAQAEKARRRKVEAANRNLKDTLGRLDARLRDALELNDEKARKDRGRLADDDGALLDAVDRALGRG